VGAPEQRVDVYLVRLDPDQPAVAGLMRVFGLDHATARDLVSRVPVRVKRNATLGDATRIRDALEALGGHVRLEPSDASPISAPPARSSSGPPSSRGPTIALGTLPVPDGFAEALAPMRETVAGESAPPSGRTPVANSLALHETALGRIVKDTVVEPFAPPREKVTSFAPDGLDAPLLSVAPKSAPMLPPASDESLEPLLMRGFEFEMDTSSPSVELDEGARTEHGHEGHVYAGVDGKGPELALDDRELAALGPSARARQSDRPFAIRPRVGSEPAEKQPSVRPPAMEPSRPPSGHPASAPLAIAPARSGPPISPPISLRPPAEAPPPLEPPARMPIWAIASLAGMGLVTAGAFVYFAMAAEDPVRIVRASDNPAPRAGGPFRSADADDVDDWVEECRDDPSCTHLEARAWLRVRTNSVVGMPERRARALVEDLYRAGASKVEIVDPVSLNGRNLAATIVAEVVPPRSTFDVESAAIQSLANIGGDVEIQRGERYVVVTTD
jgi:hypothetical protein